MRRGVLTLALLSAWLVNAAPAAAQSDEGSGWRAPASAGPLALSAPGKGTLRICPSK